MSKGVKLRSVPSPSSPEIGAPEAFVLYRKGDGVGRVDEKAIRYWRVQEDVKYLMGQVLTVVDASVASVEQREAMKQLIKNNFNQLLFDYDNWCFGTFYPGARLLIGSN